MNWQNQLLKCYKVRFLICADKVNVITKFIIQTIPNSGESGLILRTIDDDLDSKGYLSVVHHHQVQTLPHKLQFKIGPKSRSSRVATHWDSRIFLVTFELLNF